MCESKCASGLATMCEWSGRNVRVNMECASDWLCASDDVLVAHLC